MVNEDGPNPFEFVKVMDDPLGVDDPGRVIVFELN
jgi:hypothetical protein